MVILKLAFYMTILVIPIGLLRIQLRNTCQKKNKMVLSSAHSGLLTQSIFNRLLDRTAHLSARNQLFNSTLLTETTAQTINCLQNILTTGSNTQRNTPNQPKQDINFCLKTNDRAKVLTKRLKTQFDANKSGFEEDKRRQRNTERITHFSVSMATFAERLPISLQIAQEQTDSIQYLRNRKMRYQNTMERFQTQQVALSPIKPQPIPNICIVTDYEGNLLSLKTPAPMRRLLNKPKIKIDQVTTKIVLLGRKQRMTHVRQATSDSQDDWRPAVPRLTKVHFSKENNLLISQRSAKQEDQSNLFKDSLSEASISNNNPNDPFAKARKSSKMNKRQILRTQGNVNNRIEKCQLDSSLQERRTIRVNRNCSQFKAEKGF